MHGRNREWEDEVVIERKSYADKEEKERNRGVKGEE